MAEASRDPQKMQCVKFVSEVMDIPYSRLLKWSKQPDFPIFDGLTSVAKVKAWFDAKTNKTQGEAQALEAGAFPGQA
jgi:hypothetical protein